MKSIPEIIDAYLIEMSKHSYLMCKVGKVIDEMEDHSRILESNWKAWKPIKSKITNYDIEAFEALIKFRLPVDYCSFLKHKCFYNLRINDHQVTLHGNLPDPELKDWVNSLEQYELSREVLKLGYLYIADFSDYGMLCFNLNQKESIGETSIYYFDHERPEDIHFYTKSFRTLLENDENYGNRFIMKLNDFYRSK